MTGRNEAIVASDHVRILDEAWARILATPGGRMAIMDMLIRLGLYTAPVPGEPLEFLAGRRSVAVEILEHRLADPEIHAAMIVEQGDRVRQVANARALDEQVATEAEEGDPYA